MMQHLGVRLLSVSEGQVELSIPYSDKTTQQQGGFHGGAIGALADIAGGYAALTMVPEGMEVVTVEYKINMLAPAEGDVLLARGLVIKPGRTLSIARADVFGVRDGREKLVATMQQTLMVMHAMSDETRV